MLVELFGCRAFELDLSTLALRPHRVHGNDQLTLAHADWLVPARMEWNRLLRLTITGGAWSETNAQKYGFSFAGIV